MPEIKLDQNTLPADGQRVKWLPLKDESEGKWKEGEYCSGPGLFSCESGDFDDAWHVVQWEPIP